MITKSIKTTGGPLKITIPSDIKELTVGMLMDLTPDRSKGESFSQLEQLSKLSGVPLDAHDNYPDAICLYDIIDMDELAVFDEALQKLAYQLAAFVEVQAIPDKLLIPCKANYKKWFWTASEKGKVVPILSKLGISPYGAFCEAKEVIAADIKEWSEHNPGEDFNLYNPKIESLVRVLSLYLYVPATGEKFNSTRAAQFDEVVKKLFVTDALPIARYFFLKYPNLSKPKVKPSVASLKLLRSKQG